MPTETLTGRELFQYEATQNILEKRDVTPLPIDELFNRTVDAAIEELKNCVDEGLVPADVPDFASLRKYIDLPHALGGMLEWFTRPDDDEEYAKAFEEFWPKVHEQVDKWIKSGALASS